MKRKCLAIGISTVSVIILILTSLTNVVGYQTVQTSQQTIIKERINQKELLFQTIVDIANNKEIQQIILKSQMSQEIFPTSEIPVVTKQLLRQMNFIGLISSKVISKSKIQSMFQKYQLINHEIQKDTSAVIKMNNTLNREITQLRSSDCECENEDLTEWTFPILCEILDRIFWSFFGIAAIFFMLFSSTPMLKYVFGSIGMIFITTAIIFLTLGGILNCSFSPYFI